jgi:hypothetical protein
METTILKLVELFVRIDDLCKEKGIHAHAGRGRPCRLFLSEIATIYVWFLINKVRSFKKFYNGIHGKFLHPFFPKMTTYSSFLKQLKKHSRNLCILAKMDEWPEKVIIDSTSLPACENVRSKTHATFRGMAQWAYSSVDVTFGLKLHVAVSETQKIVGFALKPGSIHDVTCAEEVLGGHRGIAIGDKGYCSEPLQKRLRLKGLRFIARHRKSMRPNTNEEKKLLKNRSIVETVIGKFKNFFGATLSRFRSPQTAFSAICTGILAVNLAG